MPCHLASEDGKDSLMARKIRLACVATLVTISVGCVAILAQAQFDQAVRDF